MTPTSIQELVVFPFHFGSRFLKLNCPMYQPGFDGSRPSVDPVHLRCCGFVLVSSLISLSNQVHRAITCPTGEDGQGCKVGDCNGRHGRHRGSRGRDGAGCPPASVGSNPGGPNVQVKECESFLVRVRSHLAQLDSKCATVLENIEASEKRLSESRAKLQTPPPSEESEVNQLRGLVSQL